jgi:uncharacterized membrane protein YoaT (DUF817 family)
MMRWWVLVHCGPPPSESWTFGFHFWDTTGDSVFCIAVHFFPFRSALSCVFDGSIVIVLATTGICRCCFVMFKILVVLLGVAMRVSDLWKSLPSLYHAFCFVFFFVLHRLWTLELQLFWIRIQ